MPLIVSNKLSEYQQIKFIFGIIALISLGIFLIGLPHKMLGAELINCCQMTFLSLCLYERPVLLYTALKGLSPVTGGWSYFADDNDSDLLLLPGLTDRVPVSPFFLENSGIVAGCLVVMTLLWGALQLIKHCSCQQSKKSEEKE